ncbi:MAG: NUDIX domain-containing protein, partial [Acidobacteria bacterium]|nr:NUDIX domain-containing protein [Acidobacteriota bacterium]
MQSRTRSRLTIAGFADAAVLVPVIQRDDRICLGYTLRPDEMPTHGGQISFPGGRRNPDDPDLTATALREINEELGVAAEDVEV